MILAVDAAVANSATSLAEVTHLAWRAACAAIKVKANEVVVYGGVKESVAKNDGHYSGPPSHAANRPAVMIARVLEYVDTPPYLRNALLARHPDLALVGSLPRGGVLKGARHHLRIHDVSEYREGIVVAAANGASKSTRANVGLLSDLELDKHVKVGVRVTVRLDNRCRASDGSTTPLTGRVVSPEEAALSNGGSWAFNVRVSRDDPRKEPEAMDGLLGLEKLTFFDPDAPAEDDDDDDDDDGAGAFAPTQKKDPRWNIQNVEAEPWRVSTQTSTYRDSFVPLDVAEPSLRSFDDAAGEVVRRPYDASGSHDG